MADRDERLDALKGVAILFVVLSHSLQDKLPVPNPGLSLVYSFSMPLFMYLSGYAIGYARHRPLPTRITRRAQTLLVPYLVWSAIALTINGGVGWLTPYAPIRLLLSGPWYLLVLFLFDAILGLMQKVSKRTVPLLVMAFGVQYATRAVSVLPSIETWSHWARFHRLFPIFMLGYIMCTDDEVRAWVRRVPAVVMGVLYAGSIALLWPYFGGIGVYGSWVNTIQMPLRAPTVFLSDGLQFVSGASASLIIERVMRAISGDRVGSLAFVGSLSIGIYVLHRYFVRAWPGTGYPAVVGSFVFAVVGCVVVTLALQRFKWTRVVLLGGR